MVARKNWKKWGRGGEAEGNPIYIEEYVRIMKFLYQPPLFLLFTDSLLPSFEDLARKVSISCVSWFSAKVTQ